MGIVAQHHVRIRAVETLVDEDETHAIGDAFIDDRGGRLAGENDDRLGAKLEQKLDQRGYVLAGVGGIQKEALLALAQEPDAQQVQLLGNEGRGEIGADDADQVGAVIVQDLGQPIDAIAQLAGSL